MSQAVRTVILFGHALVSRKERTDAAHAMRDLRKTKINLMLLISLTPLTLLTIEDCFILLHS
jgi:hypothetical protein